MDIQQTFSSFQGVVIEDDPHASEARIVMFMEQLPGIAYIKDRTGQYLYFNAAGARMIGITPEDTLLKTDDELWPPHLAAVYRENDRQVLRDGRTFQGIEPVLRNGEICSWLMYKFPIVDAETRHVYLGAVGIDIAGRQQFEEWILRLRKFEQISDMAGGIAHHFNNLLTVIMGYSQLLLDELQPQDKSRTYLWEVLRAADVAADLTSQLLSFSGRQMLQFCEIDLNDLLSCIEPVLRLAIGNSNRLFLDLRAQPARVCADSQYLKRIFEALALNARDAMESGGRLTITTSNVQSRGIPYVKISIHDTGTGMSEETKLRAFEPFFTTKRPGKAVGLGLSSTYGIIKQHGGDITMQSQLGIGTTFDVLLPALPLHSDTTNHSDSRSWTIGCDSARNGPQPPDR